MMIMAPTKSGKKEDMKLRKKLKHFLYPDISTVDEGVYDHVSADYMKQ